MSHQAIYQRKIHQCFKTLRTRRSGLSKHDVLRRYKQHGLNQLGKTNTPSFKDILFRQFGNPIVVILMLAATLGYFTQDHTEAIILTSLVILNVGIDVYQVFQSSKQLNALSDVVSNKCQVIRESKTIWTDSENLVPGDLVILKAGNRVPADMRLIESANFSVNEFLLTGNPNPILKDHLHLSQDYLPIAGRFNCVFAGTEVVSGTALGIVYAIGKNTEIGKIALSTKTIEEDSLISKEMNYLSRFIGWSMLGLTVLLIVVDYFIAKHVDWQESFLPAIDLASSIIPIALPFQIALALAWTSHQILKSGIFIKESKAAEIFGSITSLALDKTATITLNELVVTDIFLNAATYKVTGLNGYEPIGEILTDKNEPLHVLPNQEIYWLNPYLASTTKINMPDQNHQRWWHNGDLIEAAITCYTQKAGFDLEKIDKLYPQIAYFPFDADRRRVATVHIVNNVRMGFVKGSLEAVLKICTHTVKDGKTSLLSDKRKERILKKAESLAEESKIVMGFACKELVFRKHYTASEVEEEMVFTGYLGIYDPPQMGMKESIEILTENDISISMITGDSLLTAEAVAKDVGLAESKDQILVGSQIRNISNASDFRDKVQEHNIRVFAQTSPRDKAKIIGYLQENGQVVAMVGDGVNDVASLHQSNIGIATVSSSPVAVGAADAVLMHSDFSLLLRGIAEGRRVYENINKIIQSSLSSNFAELFCALVGIVLHFTWQLEDKQEVPLLLLHVLLIDLVGEMLPLIMLALDPAERDLLKYPPDYTQRRINSRSLFSVIRIGFLMGFLATLSFAAVHLLNEQPLETAAAACFLSINLMQYINILDRRTKQKSLFTDYLFSNPALLWAILASFILLLLLVYLPNGQTLAWKDWFFIVLATAIFLAFTEWRKRK